MVNANVDCRISALDPESHGELVAGLERARIPYASGRRQGLLQSRRGVPAVTDILVALGSAGAFTAVWQIVKGILAGRGAREVKMSIGKLSITLKGHSGPEEESLIEEFFEQAVRSFPSTSASEHLQKSTEDEIRKPPRHARKAGR